MDDAQLSRRVTWLCRLLGVGGLMLVAVTWRLWTPQDVFPRVPLFAWAPPRWWDWASLVGLAAGLIGLCLPGLRRRRWSAALVAFGFAIQFLADQHRLQPWAWQFFILAVVVALADDGLVFRGWMLLVISIYFWSALSKMDVAFTQQIGITFHGMLFRHAADHGLMKLVNWLNDESVFAWFQLFGWGAAIMELAVAAALLTRRFRRCGYWLSILMHTWLATMLGPWGLGHQPGVLVWNVLFLVQNTLLFRGTATSLGPMLADLRWNARQWPQRIAATFLVFVLLWPATEPWGLCDAWLGWAVYVPRFHKIQIWVDDASLARLPPTLQEHKENQFNGFFCMGQSQEDREWQLFVGAVSLDELSAPIYPNHRFAVGVALDLQERYRATGMDVDLWTRNSRWTPSYNEADSFRTPPQIEAYARTFRVNALPESVLRRQAANR